MNSQSVEQIRESILWSAHSIWSVNTLFLPRDLVAAVLSFLPAELAIMR